MGETRYQRGLVNKLHVLFPGCIVLRNDSSVMQGVPDLLILYRRYWAALEVKASASAPVQPNQEHYVELMNDMCFAAFIYPENEGEVLYDLQRAFGSPR